MDTVEEIASKLVVAVENLAPKTWQLLVEAEFVESLTYLIVSLMVSVAMSIAAWWMMRQVPKDSDYMVTGILFTAVAVIALCFGVGINLPSVLNPEAITAKRIVEGVMR